MFTEEDYVSLETAKLLKEKGFDESTAGFYGSKRGLCVETPLLYNSINNRVNFVNDLLKVEFEDVIAAAPTLYEAQIGLLEKHNLYVCPTPYLSKDDECVWFIVEVYRKNKNDWEWIADADGKYISYQQALDAGIRESLKLI